MEKYKTTVTVVILEVLREAGSPTPAGLMASPFHGCLLVNCLKLNVSTHSDSISRSVLTNKMLQFFINSRCCWRRWGKCREKHHRTLWLARQGWLNSDLVAHLIQCAQLSRLLLRQGRRLVSPAEPSWGACLPPSGGQGFSPASHLGWRVGTCRFQDLHSHVPGKFLQLLPYVSPQHLGDIEDQLLPFDGLEAMRLMRNVQPNLDLLDCVQVLLIGVFKVKDEVTQSPKGQWLVHQLCPSAHAQWAIPAIAVNSQHNVVKAVSWEAGFKADGESLNGRLPIG